MEVCYHQAVCPVLACSSLDLDLRPQSQDIPYKFRSQLPHLMCTIASKLSAKNHYKRSQIPICCEV